jgi:scyllo-inositol 2-dehydrogenase (NADP+)
MKQISTAVLSYGMSGRVFHCPLLEAHAGFSLDGIVIRKPGQVVERHPKANIYQSIQEVLQTPSIELVIVNLPNAFHYSVASAVLKAGKHVVLEKPFTITEAEGERLIHEAESADRMLTVFQNRRWDGDFLTVKKVIDENRLGRVVEFEAHYDRFRNYVQENTWKEEQGPGSGILYNLGSHMIDQALSLFGKPKFVDARVGIQRTGGKVDDFYDIRMEYADKLVILKSSYLVREPGPRYVVHGEQGSFVKYGLDPQEQALNEGKIPGSENWGREQQEFWGKLNTEFNGGHYNGPLETSSGNYLAFYDGVYKSIREGVKPDVTPQQARQCIQIIEACIASNRTKRAMEIE